MLTSVKLALRISGNDFNDELNLLIADALLEINQLLGTEYTTSTTDQQIITTVIAYCKWKFGDSDSAERWAAVYLDKIEKLQIASGYGRPVNG